MQHTDSIYAAELRRRGFDHWGEESIKDTFEERLTPSLAPAFLCITINTLDITFAYDEHLVLWAVEGAVDLSDLGFTELEFSDDEPPRVLH
jgi:hypothetical protein